MPSYLGKTVLISGANRGIGLALVEHLCKDYREVETIYACTRDPANSKNLDAVASKNRQVKIVKLEVTADADIEAAAKRVKEEVGSLDVLVNNAGITPPHGTTPMQFDRHAVLNVFNVNLVSVAKMASVFLPLLEDAAAANGRPAKVLNMSSMDGSRVINSTAFFDDFAYASSKSALNMYTHCFAVLNRKIVALAMCPGHIRTDMGGSGAPLSLEQAVPTILKTLANATSKDSGRYINRKGETYEM